MQELNQQYRERRWRTFPECTSSLNDIPHGSEKISFYREKKSHQGLKKLKTTKELIAKQVNQDFLNEICELDALEYLKMEVVTAEDISPLLNLSQLKHLKIYGLRNARDISVLSQITSLNKLFIENTKYLEDLNFVNSSQLLRVIGIEGSMYTKQRIPSLEPLSQLKSLEAVFLTSVQLKDKNLDYLAALPNLKYLECARFAPKSSFDSLRKIMPDLVCSWCDKYET